MADNSFGSGGDQTPGAWDAYGPGDSPGDPSTYSAASPDVTSLITGDYSGNMGFNDIQTIGDLAPGESIVVTPGADPQMDYGDPNLDPNTYASEFPMQDQFTPPDIPLPDINIDWPQGNPPPGRAPSGSPSGSFSRGGSGSQSQGQGPNSTSGAAGFLNSLASMFGARGNAPTTRQYLNPVADRNGYYTIGRGPSVPGGAGSSAAGSIKPGAAKAPMSLKSILPWLIGGLAVLVILKKAK